MENLTIAIASAEDASSIRQVQHDTWIDTYPNEELGLTEELIRDRVASLTGPKKVKSLEEALRLENQRTWVAKDGSRIVGYCTAEKKPDINRLGAIYILPEYQNKHIGTDLINSALEWLNDKDIKVEVATYNEKAIKFYEKHGFVKTGEVGDSDRIPTIFLLKHNL